MTYKFDDFSEDEHYKVALSVHGLLHAVLMSGKENARTHRCQQKAPGGGWVCTLRVNHKGPHIGHNKTEVVGIWPNDEEDDLVIGLDLSEDEEPAVAVEVERVIETYDPYGWRGEEEEDE